jgi:hypothetical protein
MTATTLHDLTTATPVEIDTVLSGLFQAQYALYDELDTNSNWIMSQAGMHYPWTKTHRYTSTKKGTLDEAIAAITAQDSDNAKRLLAKRRELLEALAANDAEQQPYHDEFTRRHGWTRAYLVLNNNGHVHTSTHCSTCYPTTRYGWLIEMSGQDEATIVTALGSDACTVCYPTSPAIGKRTTFHTSEIEAQKAAAERQAIKDAKAAAKAAKAITNPDGTPLRIFDWTTPALYNGANEITRPARDIFMTIETLAAAKSWLTDSQEGLYRAKRPEDVSAVAEAIAHKLGTTVEVEIAAATKRAKNRK